MVASGPVWWSKHALTATFMATTPVSFPILDRLRNYEAETWLKDCVTMRYYILKVERPRL